jgi:phospholipase C
MKYAIEIGSGAMMYVLKFHEDWLSHSEIDKGGYTDTQHGDHISLLLFFQNKESRLKLKRDL